MPTNWKIEKQREAARRETKRQKKIREAKKSAGKPGYDKYGAKTVKKKIQDKYRDKGLALLTNDGKGTRVKAKTVKEGKKEGPKSNPIQADSSGVKNLGVQKPKVSKVGVLKSKGQAKPEIKGSSLTSSKKTSYQDQVSDKKKSKGLSKAKGLMGKADKAAASGKLKKAARLEKRSIRKAERAAGKRKTAVGTGLAKAGRAIFGGLAALGGSAAGLKKGGTKGSAYARAAHEKKRK